MLKRTRMPWPKCRRLLVVGAGNARGLILQWLLLTSNIFNLAAFLSHGKTGREESASCMSDQRRHVRRHALCFRDTSTVDWAMHLEQLSWGQCPSKEPSRAAFVRENLIANVLDWLDRHLEFKRTSLCSNWNKLIT